MTNTETDNEELNVAHFLFKKTKGVVLEKCVWCDLYPIYNNRK